MTKTVVVVVFFSKWHKFKFMVFRCKLCSEGMQ